MAEIEKVVVDANRFKGLWNIEVYDYNYDGKNRDLQDLLVAIANNRAAKIESEINPQSVRMRTRNKQLEKLGTALSELSTRQAGFSSDAGGSTPMPDNDWFSEEVSETIVMAGYTQYHCFHTVNGKTTKERCLTKAQIEGAIQMVKARMDALNNQAQTDMTRLQGLVDKRDESFTTASTLMSGVSDTRGNLIKSLT